MDNVVTKFALLFETLLAFILIYIPGLNSGLQLGMLHPLMFLCPMPFVLLMLVYDEIRKAIIRKHPQGWMNTETTF
jgi:sodium/potassium-transporting ATPase subunit alpha